MKFSFDLNNFPKWHEFNWIDFEISNSFFALKRLIILQNESFIQIREELDKKIKATERENGNLEEEQVYQYVEYLHGAEDRIINELEIIQDSSQITTAFSIFESKLKLICDKINHSFNFNFEDLKTKSYTEKHWNYIKAFIENDILSTQNKFLEIKNLSVIRNIIVHQNLIATIKQYNRVKTIDSLNFNEFNNSYYLFSIDLTFINELISKMEIFFEELLNKLEYRTNQIL